MPSVLARKPFVLVQDPLRVLPEENADEAAAVFIAAVPGDQQATDLA